MLAIVIITALLGDTPSKEPAHEELCRQAIRNGLKYLDGGGAELEKNASCLNCHHAPLRQWALAEASRVGLHVDGDSLSKTTHDQLKRLLILKDGYRNQQWGHSLATLYLLSGVNQGSPNESAGPKELAEIIVAEQSKDGSWKAAQQFANQRRPKRDADEAQTLWSVLALSRLDADQQASDARNRAIEWLSAKEPGSTVDTRVLRLVAEHQFGKPERTKELLTTLLNAQHDDGGWGWQPDDSSEAWPAGMALFALSSLGDEAPQSAIEKAQTFLVKTQKDDGSWLVEGKLTKNSQMSSYFGTVWGIIGLSRTLQ